MAFAGFLVDGSPINTGPFPAIDATNKKFTTSLLHPRLIGQIGIFLVPGNVIVPEDHGVVVYYEGGGEDGGGWVYLGAVWGGKPSVICRTGWESKEDVKFKESVTLGISIEPISTIINLAERPDSNLNSRNKSFGVRVARDLFNFMASFNTNSNTTFMTVPVTILERWITRFEEKFEVRLIARCCFPSASNESNTARQISLSHSEIRNFFWRAENLEVCGL